MSRWKELPADLDPRVRQLVVRLRRLKDHGGFSMRQLAAKTGYSAKSWERYLNGRSLPPREAVEAAARLGGDEPTRLLALHEVAAAVWADRRGDASAPQTPGDAHGTLPRERLRGRSLVALVAAAVALVLAASSAVLLVAQKTGGDGEDAAGQSGPATTAPASAPASAARSPVTYSCRVERIDGRWYAGNSRTRDAILAYGHAGPEVAEAQCLLHRAGLEPGEIDGIYGPLTQSAVKRVQKREGLVVDGIIGPHTWRALRS
ncbi:peptidoglycan-binding protein [Streptomyces sp. HMX87]|uniref:peptidoglycan-binding protein n=1 Tax=Streptomyces sp. HMX87 TaxID=3390849 RepID=UPI003A8AC876